MVELPGHYLGVWKEVLGGAFWSPHLPQQWGDCHQLEGCDYQGLRSLKGKV